MIPLRNHLLISSFFGAVCCVSVRYLNRVIRSIPIKDLMITANAPTVFVQAAAPLFVAKTVHQIVESQLPQDSDVSAKKRLFKLYTIEFLVWVGMTALVGSVASLSVTQAYMISAAAMVSYQVLKVVYQSFFPSTIPYERIKQEFENPDLLYPINKFLSKDNSLEAEMRSLKSHFSLTKSLLPVLEKVRTMIFQNHPEVPLRELLDSFEEMLKFAKKHNLLQINLSGAKIEEEDLETLALALPRITYLDVSETDCIDHIELFTDLKYLNLSRNPISEDDIEVFGQHLKQLRHLHLQSCGKITEKSSKTIASLFPLITLLDIKGCSITGEELDSLLKLEHLTSLYISNCTGVTASSVSSLKKITKLGFASTRLDDSGWKEFSGLKQLVELDVSNCGLTDSSFQLITDNLIGLRSFDCSLNQDLTPEGLIHLTFLKHLVELNMRAIVSVTSMIFRSMAEQLNAIEKLDVSNL